MSKTAIEMYNQHTLNEFWNFVDRLGFECDKSDAESTKLNLMRQLSPTTAAQYRKLCEILAHELYEKISPKRETAFLYAAFEAVARGKDFYTTCKTHSTTITPLLDITRVTNHFGHVFPVEDDYFTSSSYIIEDSSDYNEFDDFRD